MTELRPERPDDIPGIRAVLTAAFAGPALDGPALDGRGPALDGTGPALDGSGPVEVGLVEALRAGDAWVDGLSTVAVDAGRVVAYALLSRIVLAPADGDRPALALGPVAVLPERQRQGLGTAVVRDVLARRDDRLVVVLGDPAYYRRFGFVPGAAHGVTGAWSSFGDAWQVLPPSGGTVPGEVLYPAPWHEL